jgi:ribonuclease III
MNWLKRAFTKNPAVLVDPHLSLLEERISYVFNDQQLLKHSLSHRSYVGQQPNSKRLDSNERLEFLGDAVLDLCVSHYLFNSFPSKKEGELTKYKSIIVSGKYLVKLANEIDLGSYLLLSESEERTGGRSRASILEDAYESLIGAIFLDGGLEAAIAFIDKHMLNDLDIKQATRENRNYKSQLLEFCQSRGNGSPTYVVVEEMGPDHSKFFVVEVMVKNTPMGRGTGASKKIAEQAAARDALELVMESEKQPRSTDPDQDQTTKE